MFDLKKIVIHVHLHEKPMMDMEVDCTKHLHLAIKSITGKIVDALANHELSIQGINEAKHTIQREINNVLESDVKYKSLSSPASPKLTIHPAGTKMLLIGDTEYHVSFTRYYDNKESWAE
ncbi:hypothetical protein NRE35_004246 [Salmonella enterica]|nr:hypothetical protein [Salmonella enterica]